MRAIFVASRYALTNILLIAISAALVVGHRWIAITYLFALLVGGLIDEVVGDGPSRIGPYGRIFYEINLFATLPLLMVIAYLLFRVSTPRLNIGAMLASGYFFAVAGGTAAHELVHRTTSNVSVHCARALLAFSLNPSFEVYHVHGHHRNVGIHGDPSTALRGESLYAFAVRTTLGQWAEAWRYEVGRLQRHGTRIFSIQNRVLSGSCWILAISIVAALVAGTGGVVAFLSAAAYGRLWFEAAQYVQHYGLVRAKGAPIEAHHAWDTYRIISNAMQYNLPRHADHHMVAAKPFWNLEALDNSPKLPLGYESMILIALIPPLWRLVIKRRLADWDTRLASDEERALVLNAAGSHLPSRLLADDEAPLRPL